MVFDCLLLKKDYIFRPENVGLRFTKEEKMRIPNKDDC